MMQQFRLTASAQLIWNSGYRKKPPNMACSRREARLKQALYVKSGNKQHIEIFGEHPSR